MGPVASYFGRFEEYSVIFFCIKKYCRSKHFKWL